MTEKGTQSTQEFTMCKKHDREIGTSVLHLNICRFNLHTVCLSRGYQILNSQRSMSGSILEQNLKTQNKSLGTCDENKTLNMVMGALTLEWLSAKARERFSFPANCSSPISIFPSTSFSLSSLKLKRRRFPGRKFDCRKKT
jgi:hypothetical protein